MTPKICAIAATLFQNTFYIYNSDLLFIYFKLLLLLEQKPITAANDPMKWFCFHFDKIVSGWINKLQTVLKLWTKAEHSSLFSLQALCRCPLVKVSWSFRLSHLFSVFMYGLWRESISNRLPPDNQHDSKEAPAIHSHQDEQKVKRIIRKSPSHAGRLLQQREINTKPFVDFKWHFWVWKKKNLTKKNLQSSDKPCKQKMFLFGECFNVFCLNVCPCSVFGWVTF